MTIEKDMNTKPCQCGCATGQVAQMKQSTMTTNQQNREEWEKHLEQGECFEFEQWDCEKNTLSDLESEMVRVLTDKILPRHMPYFDWNLPFAQASIIAIRPIIKKLLESTRQSAVKEARESGYSHGWSDRADLENERIEQAKKEASKAPTTNY